MSITRTVLDDSIYSSEKELAGHVSECVYMVRNLIDMCLKDMGYSPRALAQVCLCVCVCGGGCILYPVPNPFPLANSRASNTVQFDGYEILIYECRNTVNTALSGSVQNSRSNFTHKSRVDV